MVNSLVEAGSVQPLQASPLTSDVMQTVGAVVDMIPPVTMATVSPGPNSAGWNNTNVTVTLNSIDNEHGGSGVEQITYVATGAQTIASTVVSAATTFTITNDGITTISFFGTDRAGNIATVKTITIKLDKTPPTITGSSTPPPNANGWNTTNVTVSFQCSDNLSGPALDSQPAPVVIGTEGVAQSVIGSCQDLAGNLSTAAVSGINIDKTPPAIVISAPTNGATYTANSAVSAAYACIDRLSGSATCAGNVPSGAGNPADQLASYQVSFHYVAFGISPSIVARGGKITVTAMVNSCTQTAQTISVKFALTGPLGPKSCSDKNAIMFTSPPFTIRAGTTKAVSFPFYIPKEACVGTFTTTSTTLVGGIPVDSTSATLTVH